MNCSYVVGLRLNLATLDYDMQIKPNAIPVLSGHGIRSCHGDYLLQYIESKSSNIPSSGVDESDAIDIWPDTTLDEVVSDGALVTTS